jgi:hypothetical protein
MKLSWALSSACIVSERESLKKKLNHDKIFIELKEIGQEITDEDDRRRKECIKRSY